MQNMKVSFKARHGTDLVALSCFKEEKTTGFFVAQLIQVPPLMRV